MKKVIPLFIGFLLFLSTNIRSQELKIPVLGFSAFETYLHGTSDTLYIINFWATWCGPCRRELPEFEKIHRTYYQEKVKVLLVSLDFLSQLETSLKSFIRNNQITASVVLLNEPDANTWIDKIDPAWTGSLPATLILKGNSRQFFEKELTYNDISSAIRSLTNL